MAVNEKNFNFSQTDEEYSDASLNLHNSSEGSHPYLLERIAVVFEELANTVKQENGKGLSTNDYSNEEKKKLAQALEDLGSALDSITALSNAVLGKVSKVDGMGLSHNDFTDFDKENLSSAKKTAQDNKISINSHVNDKMVHITEEERLKWNSIDNVEIDLTEYVKKTDYATDVKAGVVRVDGNSTSASGIYSNDGRLVIAHATANDISAKKSYNRPITPIFLEYAVTVCTNQDSEAELTEAQLKLPPSTQFLKEVVGDIETGLNNIIAIQNSLIGGGSV